MPDLREDNQFYIITAKKICKISVEELKESAYIEAVLHRLKNWELDLARLLDSEMRLFQVKGMGKYLVGTEEMSLPS